MLRIIKTNIDVLASAIGVVLVALSLTFVGCGEKNSTEVDQTVAEARPTTPATRPAFPPPVVEDTNETVTPVQEPLPEPEPPREVTYEEAETAYQERQYGEAVDLFTAYTERKPENPWGFYMLGLSAWKDGGLEQAEDAFTEALRLDPNHVKSWINLSRVYLDGDQPNEALASLEEALNLDAESGTAYRLQGRAYHQVGQIDEAVIAYRKAIVLDEQDAWAMNNLALLHIEQGEYDEALPILARATELRTDVPVFFNNLGMALEQTGHYRNAQEAYQSAVDLNGDYEKATINLVRITQVAEQPGLEPINLGVIAQSFVEQVAQWRSEVVAGDQSVPASEDDATPGATSGLLILEEPQMMLPVPAASDSTN